MGGVRIVWGSPTLFLSQEQLLSIPDRTLIHLLLVSECESMLNEEGTKEIDKETRDDKTDGTERNLSWRIRTRLTPTTYR